RRAPRSQRLATRHKNGCDSGRGLSIPQSPLVRGRSLHPSPAAPLWRGEFQEPRLPWPPSTLASENPACCHPFLFSSVAVSVVLHLAPTLTALIQWRSRNPCCCFGSTSFFTLSISQSGLSLAKKPLFDKIRPSASTENPRRLSLQRTAPREEL